LKKIFHLSSLEKLSFKMGYGKTSSIPRTGSLARPASGTVNGIPIESRYAANPNLKEESNNEITMGIDLNTGPFSASAFYYQRNLSDLIGSIYVDPSVFGTYLRYDNLLDVRANGIEMNLGYNWLQSQNLQYKTTLILSTFANTIKDYYQPEELRANPGAPGNGSTSLIKVKIDDPVGDFWWKELDGVSPDGSPIFANDGAFSLLGNGLPKLELGLTHHLQWKKWNFGLFFRGAFGHSLFNIHRGFYEGAIPGNFPLFFNLVNTRLAIPELTANRFSSHHAEKANFLTLDNLSISREIQLGSRNASISLVVQNLFTLTNYTGFTPEPALGDLGPSDNGGFSFNSEADLLSPGIDRRNQYMPSRMVSVGVNVFM
jgi:iron complex outermembrane receptor protein